MMKILNQLNKSIKINKFLSKHKQNKQNKQYKQHNNRNNAIKL